MSRIIDSKAFMVFTVAFFLVVTVFIAIPVMSEKPGRQEAAPEVVEKIQEAVTQHQSVIVYGDSRAAFLGEGAPLVPGWSPVVNAGLEGCSFLGQDNIWRQYGSDAGVSERSSSEQSDGSVANCDTRTYITGEGPRYDIAIVYAGTLFTVNTGTTSEVRSPVEGFMYPTESNRQWDYLLENFTDTLSRINAETIVILPTPVSHNTWGTMEDPYWDDPDRIMAVNSMLKVAAELTGAVYLEDFAALVEAQPESCQPDGAHFSVPCAVAISKWIKEQLS